MKSALTESSDVSAEMQRYRDLCERYKQKKEMIEGKHSEAEGSNAAKGKDRVAEGIMEVADKVAKFCPVEFLTGSMSSSDDVQGDKNAAGASIAAIGKVEDSDSLDKPFSSEVAGSLREQSKAPVEGGSASPSQLKAMPDVTTTVKSKAKAARTTWKKGSLSAKEPSGRRAGKGKPAMASGPDFPDGQDKDFAKMNAKEFADAMNLDGDTWQKCQDWEARKQKIKALIEDREGHKGVR